MTTYDLTSSSPSKIKTGDIINCPYSGTAKTITLPAGEYKLEVWGAQGGHGYSNNSSWANTYSNGGVGGYSCGNITFQNDTVVCLMSGGQPQTGTQSGGFNGGGTSSYSSSYGYGGGGGGGSDIRIGSDSLYARVIVAGGGGGAGSVTSSTAVGGYGGGTSGNSGASQCGSVGSGGSSTSGYAFGSGGSGSGTVGGGGGGGWYGGYGSTGDSSGVDDSSAGGGSGYIYTSSTASNYPSGCLLNSAYYLTNASTYAGNTSFTSPSGTSETGHTGNGYCRITVINAKSSVTIYVKINGKWEEFSK